MVRWFVASLFVILSTSCEAQSACQPAMLKQLSASAAQLDAALLRLNVGELWTDVPKPIQARILPLKDALAEVVDADLRCAAPSTSAKDLKAGLARILNANQPERPFNSATSGVDYGYGSALKVEVSTPPNAPQLRMIEVSFGIECGSDSVLLLYESNPAGFRRVMRWESGPYAEISGALGDFVVSSVIPAREASPLRVVVAHGSPWCSSRFSNFKIDLLEPSAAGDRPKIIWHTERGYSRGDGGTRLRATDDGFELRLNAAAFDIDTFEVPVVYRYRIAGEQVKRIAPIATNGRGFVEEWLEMPWDEAKDQVNPVAVESAKRAYDRLNPPTKASDKSFLSKTDGPVRACRGPAREFQVEIETTRETFVEGVPSGRTEVLPSTYFHLRETGNGYELEAVGTRPNPTCDGPNLMTPKR